MGTENLGYSLFIPEFGSIDFLFFGKIGNSFVNIFAKECVPRRPETRSIADIANWRLIGIGRNVPLFISHRSHLPNWLYQLQDIFGIIFLASMLLGRKISHDEVPEASSKW